MCVLYVLYIGTQPSKVNRILVMDAWLADWLVDRLTGLLTGRLTGGYYLADVLLADSGDILVRMGHTISSFAS